MLTRLEMYTSHRWKSTRDQIWEEMEQGSLLHVPEELERRVWKALAVPTENQVGTYGTLTKEVFEILWELANAN